MEKDIFEELMVVKRSGQRVNFNGYKIAVAIKHAFDSIDIPYNEITVNKVYEDVLNDIKINYEDRKTINVEDIQDIIETKLKEEKHYEVYESFSEYRKKRAASRKVFTVKQQHKFTKALEKIGYDETLKKDHDFKPKDIISGYGKTVTKEFTKAYIVDNKLLRAHEEGYIYIKDIDNFYLGIIPSVHLMFDKYINNELYDISAVLIKLREEISGEISLSAIDYLLEKYFIKKYKELFSNNLEKYLTLTGFIDYININKLKEIIKIQTSIELDLNNYDQYIKNIQIKNIITNAHNDSLIETENIIKHKLNKLFNVLSIIKDTNISFGSNTNEVGKIINKVIFETLNENKYNFKIIFKIKKNNKEFIKSIKELIQKDNEIILTFVENSYNKDINEVEYFSNGLRIFENYNSGFRESLGRMIIGEVSINMNRIALENKDKPVKYFYSQLSETLDTVKSSLLLLFETIGNKTKYNYEVLFNENILDDEKLEGKQKIRKVIKNGNLIISLSGLKESITTLNPGDEKEYSFTKEILTFINNELTRITNETKLNFYLAEEYSEKPRRSFMALDKTVYGEIKGILDSPKYDLIQNLESLKGDIKKISFLQKNFLGGHVYEINIPKNISEKKLNEEITKLEENDIGFVKINNKKRE